MKRWLEQGGGRLEKRSKPSPHGDPATIIAWNVESLTKRSRHDIAAFVDREAPDVLFLSEVKLKKGQTVDLGLDYEVHYSLADRKYAGTAVLLRRGGPYPSEIRFDLDGRNGEDGRCILLRFESFWLLHTYSPNNGFDQRGFDRRELWERHLRAWVRGIDKLLYVGDLNVAPTDDDLSHPAWFRSQGQADGEDKGQPGCTDRERAYFRALLHEGRLFDAFRASHPRANDLFSWRGSPGKGDNPYAGRFYAKGMRIDHALVSECLRDTLLDCDLLGHGIDRQGFMGSDHCPLRLRLRSDEPDAD